jgi:hypothetical protein
MPDLHSYSLATLAPASSFESSFFEAGFSLIEPCYQHQLVVWEQLRELVQKVALEPCAEESVYASPLLLGFVASEGRQGRTPVARCARRAAPSATSPAHQRRGRGRDLRKGAWAGPWGRIDLLHCRPPRRVVPCEIGLPGCASSSRPTSMGLRPAGGSS